MAEQLQSQATNVNATTVTATNVVGSTAVKSNAIQASDGGNLVSQSGTTITLGASGDTINLASGASQSGFGRTGTVDWQTSIKTSTITVVSGEGYFVNTTGGAITCKLTAGSAGAIASFRDYANTFDSNNLTISSNGSEKINGVTDNLVISAEGESLTLVYADATKGWLVVNDGNNDAGDQAAFIQLQAEQLQLLIQILKFILLQGRAHLQFVQLVMLLVQIQFLIWWSQVVQVVVVKKVVVVVLEDLENLKHQQILTQLVH